MIILGEKIKNWKSFIKPSFKGCLIIFPIFFFHFKLFFPRFSEFKTLKNFLREKILMRDDFPRKYTPLQYNHKFPTLEKRNKKKKLIIFFYFFLLQGRFWKDPVYSSSPGETMLFFFVSTESDWTKEYPLIDPFKKGVWM